MSSRQTKRQRNRFLVSCLECDFQEFRFGQYHPNVSGGCPNCGGKMARRLLGPNLQTVGYGPRYDGVGRSKRK